MKEIQITSRGLVEALGTNAVGDYVPLLMSEESLECVGKKPFFESKARTVDETINQLVDVRESHATQLKGVERCFCGPNATL